MPPGPRTEEADSLAIETPCGIRLEDGGLLPATRQKRMTSFIPIFVGTGKLLKPLESEGTLARTQYHTGFLPRSDRPIVIGQMPGCLNACIGVDAGLPVLGHVLDNRTRWKTSIK